MPWLTDLADACRKSGLKVVEQAGWRTRGHGPMSAVRGIICHHTAGARTGNYPSLKVVRDGRPGLDGPLAQLGLARDGSVLVIAAGKAWHAGAGSWPGLTGNSDCIGIEAESVGDGKDWTPAQRDAYPRLCRALAQHYKVPARNVISHKEWAPSRKIDPAGIDMRALRAAVASAPTKTATAPATPKGDSFDMADLNDLRSIVKAELAPVLKELSYLPDRTTAHVHQKQYNETIDHRGDGKLHPRLTWEFWRESHKYALINNRLLMQLVNRDIGAAVVAALPKGSADAAVVQAAVEQGIRNILGSLNDDDPKE